MQSAAMPSFAPVPPPFSGKKEDWEQWRAQYTAFLRLYYQIDLDSEDAVKQDQWKLVKDQLTLCLQGRLSKEMRSEHSGKERWKLLTAKMNKRGLHQMRELRVKVASYKLRKHEGMQAYIAGMGEMFNELKDCGIEYNSAEKIISLLEGLDTNYDMVKEEMEEVVTPGNTEAQNEAHLERLVSKLKTRARVLVAKGASVEHAHATFTKPTDDSERVLGASAKRGKARKGASSAPRSGGNGRRDRQSRPPRQCWTCQGTGHMARDCPENRGSRVRKCLICEDTGHVVAQCPLNPRRRGGFMAQPRQDSSPGWGIGGFHARVMSDTALQWTISPVLDDDDEEKVDVLGSFVDVEAAAVSTANARAMLIDSGAGAHMTPNRDELTDVQRWEGRVRVADNTEIPIEGKGYRIIGLMAEDGTTIEYRHPTFHVPKLAVSLFSVGQFADEGGEMLFKAETVKLRYKGGTHIARKVQGHYVFNPLPYGVECANTTTLLWHARLAHASVRYIKEGLLRCGVDDAISSTPLDCDICAEANMRRKPFPQEARQRAVVPLVLVHIDTFGPLPLTINGEKYGLVIVDDCTRYAWLYLLKRKSEAEHAFEKFLADVGMIQAMRVDNAGDLDAGAMEKLRIAHGIGKQETTPYDHEQHGVVESRIRVVWPMLRAVLKHSGVPVAFWGEAAKTVFFTLNRLPTRANENFASPYEAWTSEPPDLTIMRVFGSRCIVSIPRERRAGRAAKLHDRGTEGVFMGYAPGQKAYRVWLLKECRLTTSRSVKIFEDTPAGSKISLEQDDLDDDDDYVQRPLPSVDELFPINDAVTGDAAAREGPSLDNESDQLGCGESRCEEENVDGDTVQQPVDIPDIEVQEHECHSEPQRRGSRTRRPPGKYWTVANMAWHMEMHQALATSGAEYVPLTFQEAISHPQEARQWKKAIKEELGNHSTNGTFEVVPGPVPQTAVTLKWVFDKKRDESGQVVRYKARLCARGFTQRYGRDYTETFAPVVGLTVFRAIVAIATRRGFQLFHADVTSAYLHAELKEEIYVEKPEGMIVPEGCAVKLKRAIYGLKQSGRVWQQVLVEWLLQHGFERVACDGCVYTSARTSVSVGIIIGVYVDDICGTAPSQKVWTGFIVSLSEAFPIKEGQLKMYLGIVVQRTKDATLLHQESFIRRMLDSFGMSQSKPVPVPADAQRLSAWENNDEPANEKEFRRAVGMLQWIASATRPDIKWAVQQVSRYMSKPAKRHWTAVKRVMRYLCGTIKFGVVYRLSAEHPELHAFVDSDFAGDIDTRKSTYGYVIYLSGGPIGWGSKLQGIVARSSAEAEYCGIADAGKEIVHVRQLLVELGIISMEYQVPVINDSQSAIAICRETGPSKRTKHVAIRFHWIKEEVQNGHICLKWQPTQSMIADILTKPLGKQVFERLRVHVVEDGTSFG